MKRIKLKPVALAVAALLLIGAGAFVLSGLNRQQEGTDKTAQTNAPRAALTVTTVQAQQAELPIRLSANGNIAAWQEAIIGSESNGLRLTEVRVNVGDSVKAGEVLAVFAAETVQADLAQARASLMEAQANAKEAIANADRARLLEQSGAFSKQQVTQYLTAEETAKARVEAAKATLASQELRLKQTRLVAPDGGLISSRTATVGAVVPTGTELFRMIRQGRLEWRAEVTSSELGRLKTGMPVLVTAANGTQIQGRVRMFAPTVDPQTRSALVYVDLPNASGKSAPAKAGMFAKGEFDLGTSTALTLPQQSIVVRDGFDYVFVLNADHRVSQVKVQTGRRIGDRVEVRAGIKPDSVVVASGAGFLNDGDLVKVAQSPAASQPKPALGQSSPK